MKIKLSFNSRSITAKIIDSPTAQEFVSLLPLTLTLNDLYKREKFGHLPKALSTEAKRSHTYALGDIAYWSPGPDIAVFYRHDGERIPEPGLIIIGKMGADVDALNVVGSVKVTIELAK